MRYGIVVLALIALLVPVTSMAQTRESGPWWPNPEWGPDDQAGASNRITPEKILEAVGLVKTGELYELGHPYEPEMPFAGARSYAIETSGRAPARGANRYASNEEFIATQLGQVGTQFDGLAHVGHEVDMADGRAELVFYNGFTASEMDGRYGLARLGVEHAKPIITRGVLIDVAGFKGVGRLANSYEVTVADVQGALERQGMTEADLRVGDAILFRYGWSQLWSRPEAYNTNPPGIGVAVAAWAADRRPSMVGSDSWPTEVIPNPDPDLVNPVHQELLTHNGIFNLENMDLEALASDEVYEFLFIMTPIPLVGATGSPARPVAIR